MSYNLFSKPFVRVRMLDGQDAGLSLVALLQCAHAIRRLSCLSALDDFAVLRVLLALLHEAAPGRPLEGDAIQSDWLEFVQNKSSAFDLFDSDQPFFQDPTAGDEEPRPASDLFAELPTDTSINHYRHVYDADTALCPACCALGLLRMPAFCTQGGKGKSPSVNAAPPVYALPVGNALLETLALSLSALAGITGDRPCWSGQAHSTMLGPLEGFTWQPRRALLFPVVDGRPCTRCGGSEGGEKPRVVREIRFAKGRPSSAAANRNWRDPHAIHLEGKVLRAPEAIADPVAAAAHPLRIARGLLLTFDGDSDGSDAVRRAAQLNPGQPLQAAVISFASRQAKVIDDVCTTWLIGAPQDASAIQRLLSEIDDYEKMVLAIHHKELRRLRAEHPSRKGTALKSAARASLQGSHFEARAGARLVIGEAPWVAGAVPRFNRAIREGFRDWLMGAALLLTAAEREVRFTEQFGGAQTELHAASVEDELGESAFVQHLAQIPQSARDRLKRLACQPLDQDGRSYDVFADLWWTRRGKPTHRLAAMTVARLFPWLPTAQGRLGFGQAVRRLSADRWRRQLETVLASPLAELAAEMLPIIRALAQHRVGLNWASVLRDLASWDRPEQVSQRHWAQSYVEGHFHAD